MKEETKVQDAMCCNMRKEGSCVNSDKSPDGMSLEFIKAEVWRNFRGNSVSFNASQPVTTLLGQVIFSSFVEICLMYCVLLATTRE